MLAGHSFGGLVTRLYAATYPDDVVGLVLIDSAHEDYYAAVSETLTPEQRAELGIGDGLVRFSAGLEHVDDLIEDLLTALEKA